MHERAATGDRTGRADLRAGSSVRRSTGSSVPGRPRSMSVVAVMLAAVVLLAGCSSDDDPTPSKNTTTTTTSSTTTAEATTSTGVDQSTTTAPNDPTPTTADPDAPPPEEYSGPFDGQDGDTSITFTRGSSVSSVEIEALAVKCERVDTSGGTRTITIDLSFPEVPVAPDGSVDITLPDAEYQPSLSGSFGPDGVFTGAVFLSFREDGYACGGDYTFIAKPR